MIFWIFGNSKYSICSSGHPPPNRGRGESRSLDQINEPDVSLKYPDLAYLRLSASCLEIMGRNGYVQRFRIVWIRTGFGKHRPILVCSSCGGGAIRLFGRYGNYACRFCHRAHYASQKNNQFARPRLQASKLRLLQLGGWPDIREPLPPKAKWKHHKRYQKLRNQIQELEAQANRTRFRKQIDIRTFALSRLIPRIEPRQSLDLGD